MFTGIIEKCVKVAAAKKTARGVCLTLPYRSSSDPIVLGESIAVNGVCLTVARKKPASFDVEAVNETLKVTTVGEIKKGTYVNIERSLKVGDRVGGHFVFGHVDGVAQIRKLIKSKENHLIEIEYPASGERFILPKGSVAVDGVSLTVQACSEKGFTVMIIPHTAKATNLGRKEKGDRLNIEFDMLARYAQRAPFSESAFPFTIESLGCEGF